MSVDPIEAWKGSNLDLEFLLIDDADAFDDASDSAPFRGLFCVKFWYGLSCGCIFEEDLETI